MLSTRWFVAAALLALAPPWVLAQGGASAPTASPTDPLNADATVPAAAAPRTFDSYRAYRDTGPAPWRETNAAVSPKSDASADGGHAGHVMPASAPAATSNKPAGGSMPGMHHH
ncbi:MULTISPECIES: hypothetical protein [Ralstonia]|uniref:Uncharacterized protein n=1 Tax=Ralstonia mojiangensis TaxID=2953895 RepID=A0AAE3I6M2_9RALS|nr:hypothetical protein [Ralstonia mojiangensis]MCO5414659.1 hypothetical protein [Ralstonia mojiangensis]MCT7297809.1 hypothetical protein [Ralstonia mojiangensis]MCT7312147.1 hypothetical protein [Ralstonia mojiangensis]MCT7318624.1 hypothetical protein [Ralstonia mojiangensis]